MLERRLRSIWSWVTSGKSSNLFKTQLFICLCAWDNNINLKLFCKHVNVLVQVASRSSCQDGIRRARDLLKEGADAGLTQVEGDREEGGMGGKISDGSSVPRDAQPGGEVVLEPKSPFGGVPCLDGMSRLLYPLCAQSSVWRCLWEMWCLRKHRSGPRGAAFWAISQWCSSQQDPSSTFPWLQKSTTLVPHRSTAPRNSGNSQLFCGSWDLLFLRRGDSGTNYSPQYHSWLVSGHSWWLPAHLPLSILVGLWLWSHSHTCFTVKWVPRLDAMLYGIPWPWIRHFVSPWIVVLAEALRARR